MSGDVVLTKLKNVILNNGVLIEAFTGVGMVASIAANYMISNLQLDQVAAMDSDDFPPVSMIYNGRPKLPCRVYCSLELNLAVFTSEVPLPIRKHRAVASELIKWGTESGCTSFIAMDAIPREGEEAEEGARPAGELPPVWAIGTSDASRKKMKESGLETLQVGMITGVSAVMLNMGRIQKLDVIGLYADARTDIPDAAAAASLVSILNKLLRPRPFSLSLKPLLDEAKDIQVQLEKVRRQAEPAIKEPYNIYS